jgi:hypothetical protein
MRHTIDPGLALASILLKTEAINDVMEIVTYGAII